MPVLESRKLVFIHIPKAAGTSISKALGIFGCRNTGINEIYDPTIHFGHESQHATAREIFQHLENTKRDPYAYTWFTVCRDPFAKMESEYYWRKSWDREVKELEFFDFFTTYIPYALKNSSKVQYRHFLPQHRFIVLDELKIKCFKIEKDYEDLHRFLAEHANIKNIPRSNVSNKKQFSDKSKREKAERIIKKLYDLDYQQLGY